MAKLGDIRVGIDWNNSGVICWDSVLTDPLNQYTKTRAFNTQTNVSDALITFAKVIDRMPNNDSIYGVTYKITFGHAAGTGVAVFAFLDYYGFDYTTVTDYDLWVSGSATGISLVDYKFSDGTSVTRDTESLTGSTAYRRVTLNTTNALSAGKDARAFYVTGTPGQVLYIHLISATNGATTAYNDGNTASFYENVTPYINQINSYLGKSEWDNSFVDEGQATLTLLNASKLFSIENTSSALSGYLTRGKRVLFQVYNGSWNTVWSGYIDEYSLDAEVNGDRRATITAVQGIDRLRNKTYTQPIIHDTSNTTLNILKKIVAGANYISPTAAYIATVDQSAVDASYLYDESFLAPPLLITNGTPITVPWVDPDPSASVDANLRSLSELEGGGIYIGRGGEVLFQTRDYVKTLSPSITPISYYTELEYSLNQKAVTAINLTYNQWYYNIDYPIAYINRHVTSGAGVSSTADLPVYSIKRSWVEVVDNDMLFDFLFFGSSPPMNSTKIYFPNVAAISAAWFTAYDTVLSEYRPLVDDAITYTFIPKTPYEDMYTELNLQITMNVTYPPRQGHDYWFQGRVLGDVWTNEGEVTESYYNPSMLGNLEGLSISKTDNPFITTTTVRDQFLESYWSKRKVSTGWFSRSTQLYAYEGNSNILDNMISASIGTAVKFDYADQVTPTVYKTQIVEREHWSYEAGLLTKETMYSLRN